MSINFSASLDPYAIDNNGRRIDTWNINNGGSLLRLTRANVNISYNISSEMFGKKDEDEEEEEEVSEFDYVAQSGGRDDDLFGKTDDYNSLDNRDQRADSDIENPVYGSKIPWDLRFAYSASYNNNNRQGELTSHSLMFSGNIALSPRWKIRGNSSYDFVNKGFGLTSLGFQRNLKSFDMSFNWTPFGRYQQWNFFIGISASILKDLKWENRSQPPPLR